MKLNLKGVLLVVFIDFNFALFSAIPFIPLVCVGVLIGFACQYGLPERWRPIIWG